MDIRERILESGLELFLAHGVRRITMDDIARHLSVSKKTIYACFDDKDEIVSECCQGYFKNSRCEFEHVETESKDAIHEIFLTMEKLQSMFTTINPALFEDLQKFYPRVWSMYVQLKDKHVAEVIERNLLKGIEQKLYRPDINIKILVKLRIEEITLGMNTTVFPLKSFITKDVQIALLDHYLHGIVTVKGHKLINKYKNITDEE
ncbi:MAG TPA: TetR/AcrR family transcriptional regulator [Bacteroidia bacterium]|nr:TetR/AcrR family transcriptional regulator [Bacteroidia bacterium]